MDINWGQVNAVGIISKTAPICDQEEMVSNSEVADPNFVFYKPQGDNKPNDNFAEWQAGCNAGAQATISSFGSP